MKGLQLAVHDVSPLHEKVLRQISGELERMGIRRYSMLVVPDYHGEWPLERHNGFCRWLSGLAGEGVEMVLHGYSHQRRPGSYGILDRTRAALFTRGEGEFLGLDEEQARRVILDGRSRLMEMLGVKAESFVAPAWLYSRGTLRALADVGFRLAESRWRVWSPSEGSTLLRVPVANHAGGGLLKRSLASLWVRVYRTLCSGASSLRFALHPSDFRTPVSGTRALRSLERLAEGRKTAALCDLLPAP